MTRSLKYDIPGPDRRLTADEVREKGIAAIFGEVLRAPHPLVAEIGFGRGEFLRHLAAEAPGSAHLGVERSFKRVLKMARRIAREGGDNIRLIEGSAQEVVRDALADASVDTFWINFPDPWPKARHAARRLVQPPFVALLSRKLRPGGALHVATDHVAYAEEIDAALRGEALLENAFAPERYLPEVPGRMHTAYEEEWRRDGRSLHFWHYRRRPAGAASR